MTRQDLTAQPQLRETLDTHPHLTARNTRVSWYQKGKTNLDYTEARDSEWQWHQLGHMQVCTSLQTDNHANTSPTGQTPFLPPNQQRQSTKTLDIWTNSKWHAWFASSCPGRRLSTWMMTAVSCPTALAALCRQLTFLLVWCHEHSAVMATELLQPWDLACGTFSQSSCFTYELFR